MARKDRRATSATRPKVVAYAADPNGVTFERQQVEALMAVMREHGLMPVHLASMALLAMSVVGGERAARDELRWFAENLLVPEHLRGPLVEAVRGAGVTAPGSRQ